MFNDCGLSYLTSIKLDELHEIHVESNMKFCVSVNSPVQLYSRSCIYSNYLLSKHTIQRTNPVSPDKHTQTESVDFIHDNKTYISSVSLHIAPLATTVWLMYVQCVQLLAQRTELNYTETVFL